MLVAGCAIHCLVLLFVRVCLIIASTCALHSDWALGRRCFLGRRKLIDQGRDVACCEVWGVTASNNERLDHELCDFKVSLTFIWFLVDQKIILKSGFEINQNYFEVWFFFFSLPQTA